MTKIEVFRVEIECDDKIEEYNLDRFKTQGIIVWEEIYGRAFNDFAQNDGRCLYCLLKANLAYVNSLNTNEYDYYSIEIDGETEITTFILKCRLK